MNLPYTKDELYRAHLSRDPRFDGLFYVAVKTTKIYCRPICPARKAHLKNLEFFLHPNEAEERRYRPCQRCRPETAPGANPCTSSTIKRALSLIEMTPLEDISIDSLANTLAVTPRWLSELFNKHIGTTPQAYLISKRLDLARNLLDHSNMTVTQIAFASGFNSLRNFNDTFKQRFKKTPSAFRSNPRSGTPIQLELSYRPPYNWEKLLKFLEDRSISNLERVNDQSYERLFRMSGFSGWMKVMPTEGNKLKIELKLSEPRNLIGCISQIKKMFDLDADPMAIEKSLSQDVNLKPYLKQYRGLRVPGTCDGFEIAVRAIIGQKISVKGARSALAKLVFLFGEDQTIDSTLPLSKFFPTPEQLLQADLSKVGLTQSKCQALLDLAREIREKRLSLDGTQDSKEVCQRLLAIKGIGPWTVAYISMRALRDPNAFLETDLEIKKKLGKLHFNLEKWTPWRAYGNMLLWNIQL
ncbi:MAG: helix-turn-helix domain-containing protein [Simkaniaceae bacterium]|nr:helix-turn-helix domain-containing protein [Simkaniaceae bacterium]